MKLLKTMHVQHEYTYDSVKKVADDIGEHNDCAVKAVCLATRTPYERVHQLFLDAGRRFRGRTKDEYTYTVLSTLGVHLMEIPHVPNTVRECERELRFSNNYLIWTRGHILAMINGTVQDWTNGRRHRPKKVYMVCNSQS